MYGLFGKTDMVAILKKRQTRGILSKKYENYAVLDVKKTTYVSSDNSF